MKFGFRTPSLRKSLAARMSVRRAVINAAGFKAPRGWGWVTNPRKAMYNRVYNRTTRSCISVVLLAGALMILFYKLA